MGLVTPNARQRQAVAIGAFEASGGGYATRR
jgi:hypothetical protein